VRSSSSCKGTKQPRDDSSARHLTRITARGQLNKTRSCTKRRTRHSGAARLLHAMTTQNDCGISVLGEPANDDTGAHTADDFAAFFKNKVNSVRASTMTTPPYDVPSRSTPTLENWTPVTTDEFEKLISSAPCKTCQLDRVPTWLVKNMKALLFPFVTLLLNKSLAVGCFPSDFKKAVVRPLLKKAGLDISQRETSAPLRSPLAGCSSAYLVQARSNCSSVSAGQCSSVPGGLGRWTAASLRLMLPVVSGSALQVAISSSCHDTVAPSSVVGRFLLQVRQPGTRCQTISVIRRSAKTL